MINRDTDLLHWDFAQPPLVIAELETNTEVHADSRPAPGRSLHVKQMQDEQSQKKKKKNPDSH